MPRARLPPRCWCPTAYTKSTSWERHAVSSKELKKRQWGSSQRESTRQFWEEQSHVWERLSFQRTQVPPTLASLR